MENENKEAEEAKKAEDLLQEEADKKQAEEARGLVADAEKQADRIELGNKEQKELLDRQEALAAKKALGGGSEGGAKKPEPKKLTDTEYAEALERGEVNPFEEDGIKY